MKFLKTVSNLTKKIYVFLIILVLIIGVSFAVKMQNSVPPDNPLDTPVNSSLMLLSDANDSLVYNDDLLSGIGELDINEKKNEDSENKEDDKKQEENANKKKNDEKSNRADKKIGEKKTTNVEYFKTSIENNSVVEEKPFSFTITHMQEELTTKQVSVYVNNTLQPQFNGTVLLEEGKNTIRVLVEYTNKKNKVLSVFKDYSVYLDLGKLLIDTTLKNKTVNDPYFSFNALAVYEGKETSLNITHNSQTIKPDREKSSNYFTKLTKGDNIFVLSTVGGMKGTKKATKTYTVKYVPISELTIITSLDKSTYDEPTIVSKQNISFKAYALGGKNDPNLSVSADGSNIYPEKEINYNAKINKENTVITIRLTARDGSDEKTEYRYIKYVPLADEKTAPKIEEINISNGMTIKGSSFTLNIKASDYQKKRIYNDGLTVKLNGKTVNTSGGSNYIYYELILENGANNIDIRVTDNSGRYADYSYKINCVKVSEGEVLGNISIRVDASVLGLGDLINSSSVEICEGETGADVLDKFLSKSGYTFSNSGTTKDGYYIQRIKKSRIASAVKIPEDLLETMENDGLTQNSVKYSDSIGEHDYFQASGWMYSINGSFPSYGLDKAIFKEGDTVRLRFSLASGKDIGAAGTTGSGNYGKVW